MKKRTLKLLSYLLSVCMLVSSVCVTTLAAPSAFLASEKTLDDMVYVDGTFIGGGNEEGDEGEEGTVIKNVIFMIPDGAGYGSYDFSNDVKVAGGFDDAKFPYKTPVDNSPMTLRSYFAGSSGTLNVYNSMTDSAAAGTALATGVKTINNYVGIDRRKMPRANLTEAALSVGKAAGIVSTYEWCHATPASFVAHSLQRTDYGDFFRQVENKGLQVVLGAGYGTVPATIQNAIDGGYTVVKTKAEMAAVKPGDKIWGNVCDSNFNFDIYNEEGTSTLAEMTQAAITALSGDEDGFFLMVEGSKVDTGGHSNSTHEMSSDYIAFDAAFKVAVDFAKNRNDTVVIAVPDHDTGGLYYDNLVASGNLATAVAETQQGKDSALVTWESGSHTTQDVPFWGYYPEGVEGLGGYETGEDYYGNPVRTQNYVDNIDFAPWCASFMGVDLDELTEELFVDVTDIGIYDSVDKKFTFNNGDKYVYKDEGVYYLNGVKTEMEGLAIVIEGNVYVPAEIIDEEDWNYVNSATDGITGTGTKADPFVIDDAWDFLEFTNAMINGETYSGKYFVQNTDIDMTSKPQYNGVLSDVNFDGYYDGKGYTLNVKIDTTASSSNAVVFGVNNGTIVNLGVTGEIKSAGGYAAFVRKNDTNGKIANCYVNANVGSTGSSGNGFSISNYGNIENVYFGGFASHHPITGGSNVTNGYYVEGSTYSTSTAGTVVEADAAKTTLAETLNGGLSSAAAFIGGVTEDLNTWYYISGIDYPVHKLKLPEVTGITLTPSAVTVKRGEAVTLTATVLGNYNPSQRIVWEINPTPVSNKTKLYEDGFFKIGEDETQGSFTVIAKSAVAGNFAISSTVTVDLASEPVVKEDGTRTHPYLIENEDDFFEMTNNIRTGANGYKGKYLLQTADIDMDGYEGYNGVYRSISEGDPTYFQGTYDGDGYTINVNIHIEPDTVRQNFDACLFGNIANATFINMGVTGSIKSPGYVGTFARNMSQGCVFVNCWTSAHIESIAPGYGSYPGNDASGFVRSPYAGAFVNCYSIGTLISPGGTSYPFGGTGTDYKAVYYNNYYLGREYFEDEEQTEITEKEIEEGFAAKLNAGIEGAADVATATNSAGRKFVPAMFNSWIDEIGGPRHRERDDSSKIDKLTGDKHFDALVFSKDYDFDVDGKKVSADKFIVKEDASVNLGYGTYVFNEVEGDITASPNANVVVTGENKPEGYADFDIGTANGKRYAEVGGYQYEIIENSYNKYGVIASSDMLIEIVDGEAFTYYFVDASEETATKLDLDSYMENDKQQTLRYPDEKTDNKSAIRFKAEILKAAKLENVEYVIDEYGYIITLEEKLNNHNFAQLNFDFNDGSKASYVYGVAYEKSAGKDIVYNSGDDVDVFTGVFYGIPEKAYGKRIVAKTYTKITVDGTQFTLYGEPMVTSLYSLAKALVDDGSLVEGDDGYDIVKDIIDTTVNDGFGGDAGADGGELWD